MTATFCDERGAAGFSWIVDEPATRTSHALAHDGQVWLVDPVDWPQAIDRALTLGKAAAVVQLLDRHNRDCAALAARLDVPHLIAPTSLPGSQLEVVEIKRSRRWREIALWWPDQRVLVVAEAVGTNVFFTGGRGDVGVHLLLRLTPPRRQLEGFEPRHLLVGHGRGISGAEAAPALREALRTSRTGLVHVVRKVPGLALDARRRRHG